MSKYVGFKLGKVHESHVISEYYCGRCGYPVTDHDSFCPECGGAFRECDASNLEDENTKLRNEIKRRDELEGKLIRCIENDYGIMFAWDPLRKVWLSSYTDENITERDRLIAENAKLRQQIVDAYMQLGGAWARCSKLKEQIRHLYICMCNIDADGNYEYDSCEYDNIEDKCNFERLMQEMEVEVDE